MFFAVLFAAADFSYGEENPIHPWSFGVHAGYFGIPDIVLDKVFAKHPSVSGTTLGIESRYYGETGPNRILNWAFSVDYGVIEGTGDWESSEGEGVENGKITASLLSFTATAIWNAFPTRAVNPYFGIGLGAGFIKGEGKSDVKTESVSKIIPVLHVPLGVNFKVSDDIHIGIEGGLRGGIYAVGEARYLF